jgi:hypothetical protein
LKDEQRRSGQALRTRRRRGDMPANGDRGDSFWHRSDV